MKNMKIIIIIFYLLVELFWDAQYKNVLIYLFSSKKNNFISHKNLRKKNFVLTYGEQNRVKGFVGRGVHV